VADSFPSFTSSWSWAVCNDRIVSVLISPASTCTHADTTGVWGAHRLLMGR
jgi:hypothetical protein